MAELTPLDEKLAEVLGLAQAAQQATETVSKMEGAEDFGDKLERMNREASETEERTTRLVDGLDGKKTAGEEEALDGFEFLSTAEAGELCHWEIVEKMADTIGASDVLELARWAVPVQRGHVEGVREASLALAVEEAQEA